MRLTGRELRFIGVELDGISGRIAKALHPTQDIRIENFHDTRLPEGSVDAVLGNVPFADLKLAYRGPKTCSLHDFFFAKSIDALKPGGVLAARSPATLRSINRMPLSASTLAPARILSERFVCLPTPLNVKARQS